MAWNANGLQQHQHELQVVLDMKNIDVCLISETHFTKQSFIKFTGYKVYHALHPNNSAKAGSAIIIKENINHYELIKLEDQEMQVVGVSIKTKRYNNITIAAIYSPPRHAIKKDQYIELLARLGNRFILGGDFNAKNTYWGSRLTTTKGRELLSAMREIRCQSISTGKPTYWPTDTQKIPDLIDFFIYKDIPSNFIRSEEGYDMNSDHSPIELHLEEIVIEKERNPTLTNKTTDWESFRIDLDSRIDLKTFIRNREQLDLELKRFIVDIQQSAWNNTCCIKKKLKGNTYPEYIINLIKEKRALRKKWQQRRFPEDKTLLNRLAKRIKKEIRKFRDDNMASALRKLTSDRTTNYSLWKVTKRENRPINHIPPVRQLNGEWAVSNEQKAARFAQHLEETFKQTDIPICDLHREQESLVQEDREIKLVTPKEVSKEIKDNISPKKSPGFDLITGEIMKNLPLKAIVKITKIINAAFRLKYVPDLWKVAEVILIPKPGKPPQDVTSYRPISLLPVMSKLFEKLFLKQLKPIIAEKNLIPDYQFGFREKHSTIEQVHRITNIIENTLENKGVCSSVFLDVSQAFDKVWHEGLIFKLKKMLPKQFADVLVSYITNRAFRVRQEDAVSELKQIKAGVPQGSVLGPVLYLLYTCDMPELEDVTVATFADDTAIMATGKSHKEAVEKAQRGINRFYDWTKKWRIKLNESKSVHIDFTNKNHEYHPVYINGQHVPYENTAKYLGMTLDAKLRWKAHVKKKREELELRYKGMNWLLGRHSSLSISNKILLYKAVLMPIWTYGIQLWGCTKQSNTQIIQRFQNKVLRDIVNAPWYVRNDDIHRDLKVDVVAKVVRKHAEAHDHRLHHHVNIEAIQLLDNTNIVRRLRRTKPFELV